MTATLAPNSPRFIAFSLFGLAFLLRFVFALQWHATPYGAFPLIDALSYDRWALALANGDTLNAQAFYQSPVYPYLLSVLYRVTGHSLFCASLLNALLDSATAALLALVSFSLFGRAAAIITGLLAALCAPMIFYTAPVMKESLTLFLLALFLHTSLRLLQANRLRDYFFCGLCFGLAVLTRGNALFLFPLVPLFAWHRYRRAACKGIGLFILAICLAILPATLHNYAATQDFVPITYADGFNLYIGHSPTADGGNAYPPGISTEPEQERAQTTWIAEQETGRRLTPSQTSAYWRGKALAFALHNPAREIHLLILKFLAFWNNDAGPDNYDPAFIKQNFSSILTLPLVNFALISLLAAFSIVGARVTQENRPGVRFLFACVFLYMLSVLVFYVTDRYRLPILVFLLPLSGAAIPCAMNLWRQGHKKQCAAAFCAALFFLALALRTPPDRNDLAAFDWGTLTILNADNDQPAAALDAFHKGLALSPEKIGPQAYIRAAEMYEKQGEAADAARLIQQVALLYPTDGIALYNLARLQAMRGHLDEASATLRQAITLAPTYGLSYYALATIYEKQGDSAKARETVRQGLAADPDNPQLRALQAPSGAR